MENGNAGRPAGVVNIGGRMVGPGHPVFIVAEMSGNHNMDYERARSIIRLAKEAGADAVKLQTYTADTITLDCDNRYFQITQGTLWDGNTLYRLYESACTPWEWQPRLKEYAESLGLLCFSSPFDATSVDFLEDMGVPAYKIASFEITDIPLIRKTARLGKPVIISTGIARLEDIDLAVRTCRGEGNDRIILLKCTSEYPARPEDMNLRTIPNLAGTFGCPAGLSDHSMGSGIAVAGVALGACMVEKHLTVKRADGGPDAAFSMEAGEFKEMCRQIRTVEKALGTVSYDLTEGMRAERDFARSLFAVRDIRAGETVTGENVRSIRPGFGMHPRYYDGILGTVADRDIAAGTPLRWDMFRRKGENGQNDET